MYSLFHNYYQKFTSDNPHLSTIHLLIFGTCFIYWTSLGLGYGLTYMLCDEYYNMTTGCKLNAELCTDKSFHLLCYNDHGLILFFMCPVIAGIPSWGLIILFTAITLSFMQFVRSAISELIIIYYDTKINSAV